MRATCSLDFNILDSKQFIFMVPAELSISNTNTLLHKNLVKSEEM